MFIPPKIKPLRFAFILGLWGLPAFSLAQDVGLDKTRDTETRLNGRFEKETGLPRALYNLNTPTEGATAEARARHYLKSIQKQVLLRANDDFSDLKLVNVWKTPLGTTVVRFQQMAAGLPVEDAQIALTLDADGRVIFVSNGLKPAFFGQEIGLTTATNPELQAAGSNQTTTANEGMQTQSLRILHQNKTKTSLRSVRYHPETGIREYVYTDAETGQVLKTVPLGLQCKEIASTQNHNAMASDFLSTPLQALSPQPTVQVVDGKGNVFDTDPITSARGVYGDTGFLDNDDANSPELSAQLKPISLKGIQFDGQQYTLKGTYAEVIDFESPLKGLFQQSSSDFNYNRSDDAFEAVMGYYHIDTALRYVVETLQIPLVNYHYPDQSMVRYDPSGVNNVDTSYYYPDAGFLTFGEGGVDDAEDANVIWHELAHAIHDWVTNGSISNDVSNGVSEAIADYWAQSYTWSLNYWQPTDPAYHYVFRWDGHNVFWSGRITNYPNLYPSGLATTGSRIRERNAQILSSTLMKVWQAIGREATDKMVIYGLAMTTKEANQNDVANAMYQAAKQLRLSAGQMQQVYAIFSGVGYTLPAEALSIQVSVDKSTAKPSDVIEISVLIMNDTAAPRSQITAKTVVPAGLKVEPVTECNGQFSNGTLVFQLANLAPYTNVTCKFKAMVLPASNTVFFKDQMEAGESQWQKQHDSAGWDWFLQSFESVSPKTAWQAAGIDLASEQVLVQAAETKPLTGQPQLNFWHKYETENQADGGVVEVSTDNGATWEDLGAKFILNGYPNKITSHFSTNLTNKLAFTGKSNTFINSIADLSGYVGKPIRVRFRFVTDLSTRSGQGWFVDDVMVVDAPMISQMFCASSAEGDQVCGAAQTLILGSTSVEDGKEITQPHTPVITAAYPNPFREQAYFTVQVPQTQAVQVELLDILGRPVARLFDEILVAHEAKTIQIKAENLPNGLYVYRVVGKDFTQVKKVVLSR